MGTLGKAYGSFGAFILASSHIIDYLINRAKPIIYATSLSLYDTILGHNALRYIIKNKQMLKQQIKARQQIIKDEFDIEVDGLIVPLHIGDNTKVITIRDKLFLQGFAVGGIREPTVKSAIIRLIARLYEDEKSLRELCRYIKRELDA